MGLILSIVQLAVAIFMIGFGQSVEKDVQEYGKEYKIKINIIVTHYVLSSLISIANHTISDALTIRSILSYI